MRTFSAIHKTRCDSLVFLDKGQIEGSCPGSIATCKWKGGESLFDIFLGKEGQEEPGHAGYCISDQAVVR